MDIELRFLADRPDALQRIASWYVEEWGHTDPSRTVADIAQRLSGNLNRDTVPLSLVALSKGAVIGTAELKYREMDMFPDHEHWLGGVYVVPDARSSGCGAQIVEGIVNQARHLGVKTLWLQTERLDGGLYSKLGWEAWKQVDRNGIKVLVMERSIGI